jgi:hypothetical protein
MNILNVSFPQSLNGSSSISVFKNILGNILNL